MWTQPRNQFLPWMQSLSTRMKALGVPKLDTPNLWISSDYVFGNSKSAFDVIAVLLANPERSFGWEPRRQNIRHEVLGSKRKMSFKSLGDRVRQRSLVPFLEAADTIHGVVVSIALDKAICEHFVFGPEQINEPEGRDWLSAKWKEKPLDRMVTIAHFVAFLVAGVSTPAQDLLWISDQDDAFANQEFSNDTGRLFTRFLSLYSNHEYGSISIGTTAITEPDQLEEDLSAVADIAAGGSADLLTSIRNRWGRIPGIAVEMPNLSTRTQFFFDWFSCKSTTLKKIGCVFEQDGRALRISTWT